MWTFVVGVVLVGSAVVAVAQSRYMKIADAPEYLRTGPARGVRYETTAELQKNYQMQCADDESEARSKLAVERREAKKVQKDAVQAEQASQQRSQLAQQQCDESKRILYVKKRRTDLNEGEKAELLRFEENYKSRCG